MDETIYTSPLAEQVIPNVPITEHVLRLAAERADQPALIDGMSGESYSFSELADAIARLAGGMRTIE